jgi:hypothetical protein
MRISIYEIKERLKIKGDDLNSRDWGVKVRKEIEVEIKNNLQSPDDIIYLDFNKIKSFNSSIADEVVVLLMKEIINKPQSAIL